MGCSLCINKRCVPTFNAAHLPTVSVALVPQQPARQLQRQGQATTGGDDLALQTGGTRICGTLAGCALPEELARCCAAQQLKLAPQELGRNGLWAVVLLE